MQALIRRAGHETEPTRLAAGDLSLDLLTREVKRGETKLDLQPREFALLEYLMRNAGKVVSKTMIIEHVWGYDFDPMTNVVDVLVSRLRSKLDRDFDGKLIQTHRGVVMRLSISSFLSPDPRLSPDGMVLGNLYRQFFSPVVGILFVSVLVHARPPPRDSVLSCANMWL